MITVTRFNYHHVEEDEGQAVDSLSMGVLVRYRPRPPASQYANYVSREQ